MASAPQTELESLAPPRRRHTLAEIEEIVRAAQEEVRAANPTGRDLVAELIAERRAEAELE